LKLQKRTFKGGVCTKMIKAVLFDLDGTLLDRDESVKKFIDCQYDCGYVSFYVEDYNNFK
jgi:FMN phosphatase YigB (HAD superfamily)